MAYPTIDELLKGEGGVNIRQVLENCSESRRQHRLYKNGFNKSRTMRSTSEIPYYLQFVHEVTKKFFDPSMDKHEMKKAEQEFLRLYPQFLTVDRYGKNLGI